MSQPKAIRKVTIICRYAIKVSGISNGVFYKAGSVVLLVENDKGVRYTVTLRRNRKHTCTCEAFEEGKGNGRRECYHITYCKAVENARAAREVAKLKQEVEAICAEVEAETAGDGLGHELQPTPIRGNHVHELKQAS